MAAGTCTKFRKGIDMKTEAMYDGRDVTRMMPQRFGCTDCRMVSGTVCWWIRSGTVSNWSVFLYTTGLVYGRILKEVKDTLFLDKVHEERIM